MGENMEDNTAEPRLDADEANSSSSFHLESADPEQRQKLEEELKKELAKVSFYFMAPGI